jgi:heme oxygenase
MEQPHFFIRLIYYTESQNCILCRPEPVFGHVRVRQIGLLSQGAMLHRLTESIP